MHVFEKTPYIIKFLRDGEVNYAFRRPRITTKKTNPDPIVTDDGGKYDIHSSP